jgi:alanine racemase
MYAFSTLAARLSGQAVARAEPERPIVHLSLDTRQLQDGRTTLFLAIQGAHADGHAYLQQAFEKGCRSFVVEADPADFLSPDALAQANILWVPETVTALQTLAAFHREHFQLPVIGITGSNGKTMVKEWLYQLLYPDWRIVKSPRSYNSQIGVPLAVWQLRADHELAIFEAGLSQPGEMASLEPVIQPTLGIFTNLGEAHQANFASYQEKAREKLALFRHVHTLIYPTAYPALQEVITHQRESAYFQHPDFQLWGWDKDGEARSGAIQVASDPEHQNLSLQQGSSRYTIGFPFTDQASVENAGHCWLATLSLGYQPTALHERFRHLTPVAMRLELKKGINRCTLINDTYNSDLASLRIALAELSRQQQHARRTVILSDLLESSDQEAELYQAVGKLLQQYQVDRIIGIGPALGRQQAQLPRHTLTYSSTEAFLADLAAFQFTDESILLKGSRQFAFEQISRQLEQTTHRTVLEVHLGALIQNLNAYRKRLQPGTRSMVMVKAFSYGSGTYEIASLLQHHRVDYLAVAYADEGVALREAGITMPIVVLNPEVQAFPSILAYNLEPEIYSLSHFQHLLWAIDQHQPAQAVPVHLMLDTGMHRLGFEQEELPDLLQALTASRQVQVASVFSHLVASDDPQEDAFTRQQIAAFQQMSQQVQEQLPYPVMRHILNTNGVLRFPEAQFEMVRLGIGFYGVDGTGQLADELTIPASLKTTISQVKHLKPGATVGYGRKGKITKPTTIATLAIGYADGFSRALGNGQGFVNIHGHPAPVVGDVCMDMTMVDVTGIPAREGDEAVVFGDDPRIEAVARRSGTIPYEVLTSVSQRVKRVYYQE